MSISGKPMEVVDLWMWVETWIHQSDGTCLISEPFGWNICFLLIFVRMLPVSDLIFSFWTPFAGLPLSLAAEQLTCEAKAAPDQENQHLRQLQWLPLPAGQFW